VKRIVCSAEDKVDGV